jgi:WD40 repeat protein
VAGGSADRTFIIWDAQTGEVLRRFTDLHSGIYSATFSLDGRQLLVGYIDGTIELWRVDTTEDLIAWTHANRYIREFTCGERTQYRITPLCE